MLENYFIDVYDKFKLNFYRNIFKGFENREANLTIVETLCAEVINALDKPTISDLTEFMEVSQPNMTYRVSNLVDKGYVKRIQSTKDRREYYLEVTDKYERYNNIKNEYIFEVLKRVRERYDENTVKIIEDLLKTMSQELMGEITDFLE